MFIKNAGVIVVEPHDHPSPDEEVVRLNGVNGFDQIEFLVLSLASLGQARLPRRFDPDEDGREICVAEQRSSSSSRTTSMLIWVKNDRGRRCRGVPRRQLT